jgi:hypothetical protein
VKYRPIELPLFAAWAVSYPLSLSVHTAPSAEERRQALETEAPPRDRLAVSRRHSVGAAGDPIGKRFSMRRQLVA